MRCLSGSRDLIVLPRVKFLPSPVGHQLDWWAPFGKYTYAMRRGAPVAAAATAGAAPAVGVAQARLPSSESNAGSAMHAPSPRRKRRRLRLAWRWAASSSRLGMFIASLLDRKSVVEGKT